MIHVEGNMCGAVMRGAVALPGSKATSRTKGSHRNLGDLVWPAVATAIPGRGRKARSRRCLGTGEELDGPRSTGEAPEQGRDERRRRAWREGGSVGGMADDGRCSGRRTGPSILYPPLACGSATRSNVRARPIALDFRQEPGAGKPHAGICAGAGSNPCPYRDRARKRYGPGDVGRPISGTRARWGRSPSWRGPKRWAIQSRASVLHPLDRFPRVQVRGRDDDFGASRTPWRGRRKPPLIFRCRSAS